MADRRIKPDEAALWDAVTDDIRPLMPNKRSALTQSVEAGAPVAEPKQKKRMEPIKKSGATVVPPPIADNPNVNIDKRTLGRLKRGKLEIEGWLDLHGHTQDSAHRALDAFIEAAYESQRRCVLIITGKGMRGPDGNRGVLRQVVPAWLSDSKLKPLIVSWQPAQPRDGGDGAMYVLIRRKR